MAWSDDLTAEGGMDVAWKYIEWVGQNMPGYDYPRKAPALVSTLLVCRDSFLAQPS